MPFFVAGDAAWQAFFAAVPVLTVERFGADAKIAGALFAAVRRGRSDRELPLVPLPCAAGRGPAADRALGAVPGRSALAADVRRRRRGVMFVALLISGVGNGVCNPSIHSIYTLRMPPAIRAKAMAAGMTIWGLAMPLGLVIAGPS